MDGTPLHDPDEVTEAFRNKAELWRQLNPGPGPFPGRFIVLASSRVETSALLPWLAAVQRAGFSSFGVYMRAPLVPIATKTRGILYKQRCCVRPITLAETAQPLSRFKTWGELARATQGTALSVSLH